MTRFMMGSAVCVCVCVCDSWIEEMSETTFTGRHAIFTQKFSRCIAQRRKCIFHILFVFCYVYSFLSLFYPRRQINCSFLFQRVFFLKFSCCLRNGIFLSECIDNQDSIDNRTVSKSEFLREQLQGCEETHQCSSSR